MSTLEEDVIILVKLKTAIDIEASVQKMINENFNCKRKLF